MNCLIQFAKRPLPGFVKTRLIPDLGEEKATEVHTRLLFETLGTLNQSNLGEVQLWWDAPWDDSDFLGQQHKRYLTEVKRRVQKGSNLGERMFNALSLSLLAFPKVVLVGSDCPVLNSDYLQQAFSALDNHDLVIGPSDDGGYVLIGAKRITASVFDNINWGTDSVLESTRQRIAEEQLQHQELPVLWDVDLIDDFNRWSQMENPSST